MFRFTPMQNASKSGGHAAGAAMLDNANRAGMLKRRLTSDPRVSYFLHVSSRMRTDGPLMIAVHGISRQADLQALLFRPYIESAGGILVAPEFKQKFFSDYQRLGRRGRGQRADLALKRILADVAEFTGRPLQPIVMFGYSGGGQFVHRFAMGNPRLVKRMAVAAAGWFTFPDSGRSYPEGISWSRRLPDLMFDPARFLQIPALVIVGEYDVERDAALSKRQSVDQNQGMNRVERARRWVAAMEEAAARYNYDTQFSFETVSGCGHSFEECMTAGNMGNMVAEFLLKQDDTKERVIPGIHSYRAGARDAAGGSR